MTNGHCRTWCGCDRVGVGEGVGMGVRVSKCVHVEGWEGFREL